MIRYMLAALVAAAAGGLMTGEAHGAGAPDAERFIVKFQAGKADKGRAALAAARAEVLLELGPQNAVAAHIPGQAVAGLSSNPNIEYIEADPPRYPMAETVPYGVKLVQASPADGGLAPGGSFRPKVCVIDSGYDQGHGDLRGGQGSTDTVTGYPSGWNSDGCGHGTHVTGTIAALTGNNTGVAGVLGTAPADLYIVRVFGDSCGWSYASTLVDASNRCASAGANIISMSLGCSGSVRRCGSNLERNTFQAHYDNGILNVAAAGNDGNTQRSWPASYPSVISVAAVDSNEVVASFSQQNSDVELAAPGVAVRSTLPRGTGKEESLAVGSTGYEAIALDGSPDDDGSGPLVNCGLGTSDCPGGGGQVCLIQRGNISFADKVLACQAGGGAAAVIYNNEPGLFSGTLSTTVTNIPSVGISKADGEALAASGGNATVSVAVGDYGYLDGTSMATPHVAGVAALIWTYNGSYTAAQIRQALQTYAKDLGPAGKDDAYGYGLVQASAASFCLANPSDALCTGDGGGGGGGGGGDTGGGGGGSCELGQAGDACSSDAECCSNSCKGKPGSKTCK